MKSVKKMHRDLGRKFIARLIRDKNPYKALN